MRSRLSLLSLLLLFQLVAPLGAQDASSLADDPRVADAIHAWEEWLEYQAAIDRLPGASVDEWHSRRDLPLRDRRGRRRDALSTPHN